MKHEYHEGPKASEKFNMTVTQLFRVPKSTLKPTAKPVRKPTKTSKDFSVM
jgi:hypothetical protein